MLVFNRLSDRGYSIAKILGLFTIGYVLFLLATLKIMPLSFKSLPLVFFAWAGINIFLELKYKIVSRHLPCCRQILLIEIAFITLMGFWVYIRAHQPQIYEIERFMDFGFIQALFNSTTLPLNDIWFLGKPLTYYYFGHFLGYVMLSLSKIPLVPGFFVLVSWLFALIGINVYRLGRDATSFLLSPATAPKIFSIIGGFLAFFIVMLAGTWHTIAWGVSYLYHFIFGNPVPSFWYPDLTRIIPGTITEVPLYAFLVADLHAHVWGLLSGIAVLTILFLLWIDKNAKLGLKNKYLWLLAFSLGIAYMINSFDGFTLGALTALFFIVKFHSTVKIKPFLFTALLAIIAYAIALPWSLFSMPSGAKSFSVVPTSSPFLKWFSFWGTVVILIAVFWWTVLKERLTKKKSKNWLPFEKRFHALIIIAVLFFLILMEVLYVKDILFQGEWFRANTVFKISFQLWLWIGVISGSVILWAIKATQKTGWRILLTAFFALMLIGQAIYPVKTIIQATLENKKLTGLGAGLEWWQKKFPYDFEVYQYLINLRDRLPLQKRLKNIVEAEGDSYTDVSRFSVFLGWPTIVGWPIHEWTWRGSYDEIGVRRSEVIEIYTGVSEDKTREILKKYALDYIIVGEVERQRYPNLNTEKLFRMGKVVFRNDKSFIVEIAGL